jgi:hypothetical protein
VLRQRGVENDEVMLQVKHGSGGNMRANSLNHFKSVLAHHFFIKQADQNYFLARFSRIHGIHQEFYWQALQAIEKYLKAGLVLNDVSVLRYSHNIDDIFSEHGKFFSDLSIRSLENRHLFAMNIGRQSPWRDSSLGLMIKGSPAVGMG